MQIRVIEVGVGVFIAVGFAALLVLALKVSNLASLSDSGSYELTARFDDIGGLKARSPVTMAGVKIGRVSSIDFDDTTYEAVVTLSILPAYKNLPIDTSASIFTSGLLGEQYIGLEAGGEEEFLKDGSEIELTQSAIVLEKLIGKFMLTKAVESRAVE